jgi:hypothetical protein
MTDEPPTKASKFYDLLDGAKAVTLWFQVNEDEEGPFWTDEGELIASAGDADWCEKVQVVDLGFGRYRLARVEDIFSQLRLNWGDEFLGSTKDGINIKLEKVVAPEPYAHFKLIGHGPIDIKSELSKLIHSLDGGWECSFDGMWLISIPANNSELFIRSGQLKGLKRNSR